MNQSFLSPRYEPSDAENLLWSFLEDQQLFSRKFLRHYRVGSYTPDFFCPDKNLVIERVDLHQGLVDSNQNDFLENESIRLLQSHCDEVFNRTADVFKQIEGVLNKDRGF